jgi:hypothetical protein
MLIKLISDHHYIAADDISTVQLDANGAIHIVTKTCRHLEFSAGTRERILKEFNRIVAEVNAATTSVRAAS